MWRSRALLAALASLSLALGAAGSAQAGVGLPPVVSHVPTQDEVVFITIDDGWNHDPEAARILLEKRVPVSLFLLPGATAYDTGYFTALTGQGRATVENHTVNHPDLTTLDAAGKDAEVCGAGERLAATFGGRSPGCCGRRTGRSTTPCGPRRRRAG